MGKEKKKKRDRGSLKMMGIGVLIGGLCGILLGHMLSTPAIEAISFPLDMLLLCLFLCLFFFLHTLLHEGGHLLFGLLTGYRFCSFRIFSFMWLYDGEKLRFARHSLPGTGGQCLLEPPDMVDGKIPYVLYNLGGVLMNALLSLLALLVTLLWGQDSAWGILCLLFAVAGLISALTNGVPMEVNLISNDGNNLRNLRRHPESLRALWIQLKVNACQTRGMALQDMPEEWFAMPDPSAMTDPLVAALGDFHECLLLERQEFDKAESLIHELLADEQIALGMYKPMLRNDGIYLALLRGDREAAGKLLTPEQQVYMKKFRTLSFFRTGYAVALLLDGDEKAAGKIRQDFEKTADRWPYTHDLADERSLLQRVDILWKAAQAEQ